MHIMNYKSLIESSKRKFSSKPSPRICCSWPYKWSLKADLSVSFLVPSFTTLICRIPVPELEATSNGALMAAWSTWSDYYSPATPYSPFFSALASSEHADVADGSSSLSCFRTCTHTTSNLDFHAVRAARKAGGLRSMQIMQARCCKSEARQRS